MRPANILRVSLALLLPASHAFTVQNSPQPHRSPTPVLSSSDLPPDDGTSTRFPTSVDDQVRQAASAISRAKADGVTRHEIRLLLPLIGATELDDWPGGARQMIAAARPLISDVLRGLGGGGATLDEFPVDESDGIVALVCRAEKAADDSAAVLLPTAECVKAVRGLSDQVGMERNLLLVNPQYRRRADFPLFGGAAGVEYVGGFAPTFSCTSLMVEGEQVRVIRAYPGPWRVFILVQVSEEKGEKGIDWVEVGSKEVTAPVGEKSVDRMGMVSYGKPSYQGIEEMITSQEGYVPKNVVERATVAVTFIKDTL